MVSKSILKVVLVIFLVMIIPTMIVLTWAVPASAGQAQAPVQNMATPTATVTEANAVAQPDNDVDAVTPADTPDTALDPASLIPDPPPLPHAKATLIGGTIERLDRVRDQLTARVFGGGKMSIAFDPRTRIYVGRTEASTSNLHQGDRISVDTMLDGSIVFAKIIRINTTTPAGESQGVIISYRGDKNELDLRDALSPRPLKIHLTSETRVIDGDHSASPAALVPGTLVAVKFGPQRDGSDTAREVSVLAVPGASFTFNGRVAALDLRLGRLVLNSSTDRKTYEVYLDPASPAVDGGLREGVVVTVLTRFDGSRYVARSVTVSAENQR